MIEQLWGAVRFDMNIEHYHALLAAALCSSNNTHHTTTVWLHSPSLTQSQPELCRHLVIPRLLRIFNRSFRFAGLKACFRMISPLFEQSWQTRSPGQTLHHAVEVACVAQVAKAPDPSCCGGSFIGSFVFFRLGRLRA